MTATASVYSLAGRHHTVMTGIKKLYGQPSWPGSLSSGTTTSTTSFPESTVILAPLDDYLHRIYRKAVSMMTYDLYGWLWVPCSDCSDYEMLLPQDFVKRTKHC